MNVLVLSCQLRVCTGNTVYDIAFLTFLTLVISQKSFDIADFFYFEETFRSECSERNERRKCLGKIKKYQQYQIGFL